MTWKIRIPTCHDQCMGPHILHKIYTEENKANSLRLEYYSMWLLKDNVLVYMDFRPLYQRFSSTFIFSSFPFQLKRGIELIMISDIDVYNLIIDVIHS